MTEGWGVIIGAVVGIIGTGIGMLVHARIEKRRRADDLFTTALSFLSGGTQKRNLGIAAIDLCRREFPQYEKLCVEMLIGSAIYLLTESEQKDKAHEKFNLHRIMVILTEMPSAVRGREVFMVLKNELKKRIDSYQEKPEKGLWIVKEVLQGWLADLNKLAR